MASHWELTGLDFLTGFSHLMSPVVSEGLLQATRSLILVEGHLQDMSCSKVYVDRKPKNCKIIAMLLPDLSLESGFEKTWYEI